MANKKNVVSEKNRQAPLVEENQALLIKEDQARLASLLNFLTMFFDFDNTKLLEITPEWVEEYSQEISSISKRNLLPIHRYWHDELSPDHQIIFIDHLLMQVLFAAEKVCNGTHISEWLKNDSFAAWQICLFQTELMALYEIFIKRISFGGFGAIESVYGGLPREDFREEADRIINDPEFGLGEFKEKVNFNFFKQTSKWLERLSCDNSGLAIKLGVTHFSDKNLEEILDSIVKGEKTFLAVSNDLGLKPTVLKKRLLEAGRFRRMFRVLWQGSHRDEDKLACEMGVTRKAIYNWRLEYLN